MNSLKDIFNNRRLIWEGLKNNLFKQDHIEEIYKERELICKICTHYDNSGEGCVMPGTQPCCNKNMPDGCGCSLSLKLRSLSSSCPLNKWKAIVTEQEDEMIKSQISKNNDTKNG